MFCLLALARSHSIDSVPTQFSFPEQRFLHSWACLTNMFPFKQKRDEEKKMERGKEKERECVCVCVLGGVEEVRKGKTGVLLV